MSSPVEISVASRRQSVMDELEILIRARYPIIHVVTWEERRVEQQLRRFAVDRTKQLYCWSVTTGLVKSQAGHPISRNKGLAEPIEALDAVIEHKEPAIYLFKDFHAFMRPRDGNIGVIRKLREVALALSDSYKTLVITSPLLDIAPELQKDVCVLDYPLPETDDFARLLDRICADVADSANISHRQSRPKIPRETHPGGARPDAAGGGKRLRQDDRQRRHAGRRRRVGRLLRKAADHPQERPARVLRIQRRCSTTWAGLRCSRTG
jgi:hypothetical protein